MTTRQDSFVTTNRLKQRFSREADAERTGKTFRRHPERMLLEKYFVKPALEAALKVTGLYRLGTRNALRPTVKQLSLVFPDLPADFDGFHILHLSDLHIDALPELAKVVADAVSAVDADLCVITGDYRFATEGPCDEAVQGMRTILGSIRSRYPVLATLGNHDPCEIASHLEELGFHLLINEATEIREGRSSLWIAGVDDSYDYRCDDLPAALENVPERAFKILLSHTPDLFSEAEAAGVKLYLCGHTHSGQVRLPLIGSVIQNSTAPREYTHGAWRHKRMRGYTSAGIGCSMLPVRFGCPPEIILIELRKTPVVRSAPLGARMDVKQLKVLGKPKLAHCFRS